MKIIHVRETGEKRGWCLVSPQSSHIFLQSFSQFALSPLSRSLEQANCTGVHVC